MLQPREMFKVQNHDRVPEPEPKRRGALGWSFWLLALAPSIAATIADVLIAVEGLRGMDSLGSMLGASFIFGLALNLICAPLAGIRYATWSKPRRWRVASVIGYASLFFLMNILLLPAGCACAGLVTKMAGQR